MARQPLRVAFINQPFGTLSNGAAGDSIGLWIQEVGRRLAERFIVRIYAKQGKGQSASETFDGVECRRVNIGFDMQTNRIVDFLSRFRRSARPAVASSWHYRVYASTVARDIGSGEFDAVYIPNFTQYAPLIRAYSPGSKILLHMHCEWLSQLAHAWMRERIEPVDRILGCSDYITDKIRTRFPDAASRCKTLYNGADRKRFECSSRRKQKDETKRILFVGRVSPEKGLHTLVDAFNTVVEQRSDVELEIVGPQWRTPLEYIIDMSDHLKREDFEAFYECSYKECLRR